MFVNLRGRQRRVLILIATITLNIVCTTAGPNHTGNNSPINQKEVNNARFDDMVGGGSISDEAIFLTNFNTIRNEAALAMSGAGGQGARHMNKLAWSNALKKTADKKVDSITEAGCDNAGICYWLGDRVNLTGPLGLQVLHDKATKVGCVRRQVKFACAFDVAYTGGEVYEKGKACSECKCDVYFKGLCQSNMAAVTKASIVLLFAGFLASLFMA